ncbi:MAG: PEP-CTERM sorting domain-containing protein [Planctomycetota bacterium]
MTHCKRFFVFSIAGSLGLAASAQIISDDFETDTSANYTLVDEANAASGDGTPDSTSAFAFDYIAAGIPLAPNSAPGDTGGLRFAANETGDDAGAPDHITAFHNTPVTSQFFTLTVDVYMDVEAASGSTEFTHVGVAGSTADFLSIFTPVVTNGHTLAFTGDGGSASDYRHSDADQIFNTGDATYLDPANSTNGTGDLYQALFPNGSPAAGSPGNLWTTLEIVNDGSALTYSLDGTPIIRTSFNGTDGDLVSLGYADVFNSVGPHAVIFDNLTVTDVPEPATAALLGLGALAMLRRRGA